LSQSLLHLHFNLSIISETFATKVIFYWTEQLKVTGGQVRAVRRTFKKLPTVVLEFSPGLLGLYGVWHCHDEAAPLLPVGLDALCELNPEASAELHSIIQNSHFQHTIENGLTVLSENPKTQ
jgi:hypothetical protein